MYAAIELDIPRPTSFAPARVRSSRRSSATQDPHMTVSVCPRRGLVRVVVCEVEDDVQGGVQSLLRIDGPGRRDDVVPLVELPQVRVTGPHVLRVVVLDR